MASDPSLGAMNVSVQIVRRDLLPPAPGSAEPRHDYAVKLTTRAEAKSKQGTNEFAAVDINGKRSTHSFTIRYTTIMIDVRDRVRDARGQLYQILAVENVDLGNRLYRLHCANIGQEDTEATA